jgi:hypothetical protein
MRMTVYIVQKLHWEYDDVFYILEGEHPVKAFVKKESAEAYRAKLEAEAKKNWHQTYGPRHRAFVTERGLEEIPEVIYEVVPVEIEESKKSEDTKSDGVAT